MGSSNPWGDLDQMWRVRRYRGRNHVCNIWWLSVKGCGCGERGKFAFSHWLDASPLYNTGHTTVWPCDHFTVYAVLWTEKLIFLNKQCFYRYNKMFSGINSYTCSNAVFQHWHISTVVLPLVYCPADDTLFEVGPEIRCSGMSSRYCCYGNHTDGFKPI